MAPKKDSASASADERPGDIIQMTYDGKTYADTTVEAFNEVWEPKGWKRASDQLVESTDASATQADNEEVTP